MAHVPADGAVTTITGRYHELRQIVAPVDRRGRLAAYVEQRTSGEQAAPRGTRDASARIDAAASAASPRTPT